MERRGKCKQAGWFIGFIPSSFSYCHLFYLPLPPPPARYNSIQAELCQSFLNQFVQQNWLICVCVCVQKERVVACFGRRRIIIISICGTPLSLSFSLCAFFLVPLNVQFHSVSSSVCVLKSALKTGPCLLLPLTHSLTHSLTLNLSLFLSLSPFFFLHLIS